MAMDVHEGPGVLPGRYEGGPIVLHPSPTAWQLQIDRERAEADTLAGRIGAAAALSAQSECGLLELIGEFDATDAIRGWSHVKSLTHWLSWTCSMTPGVAREHVRVARALRRMPKVLTAFRDGRLSYSKVREVTRVVDVVDEEQLCRLALTATASQLARTISAYSSADGSRIPQQAKRTVTWQTRDDGMVDVRGRLSAEEAAVLIAALDAAKDQFGAPPAKSGRELLRPTGDEAEVEQTVEQVDSTSTYTYADALLDVARTFLDSTPEDRSGEDRRLVVVHVSAENLAGRSGDGVPAGTPGEQVLALTAEYFAGADGSADSDAVGDVPAGTLAHRASPDPTCHVEGVGPIERQTARRLACDSPLLGAIVDRHGDVLALGRARRLVSRGQRRALMIRDGMCQFPGCPQTRHLDAHHRISWLDGGPTDLHNLILLCRWHHTAVHEGRMTITPGSDSRRWEFRMPDGTPHRPWYTDDNLRRILVDHLERQRQDHTAALAHVDSFNHPDARTIRPRLVWRAVRPPRMRPCPLRHAIA